LVQEQHRPYMPKVTSFYTVLRLRVRQWFH